MGNFIAKKKENDGVEMNETDPGNKLQQDAAEAERVSNEEQNWNMGGAKKTKRTRVKVKKVKKVLKRGQKSIKTNESFFRASHLPQEHV
jgi:hypothetical protein